jgi:hypothetical protein
VFGFDQLCHGFVRRARAGTVSFAVNVEPIPSFFALFEDAHGIAPFGFDDWLGQPGREGDQVCSGLLAEEDGLITGATGAFPSRPPAFLESQIGLSFGETPSASSAPNAPSPTSTSPSR